MGFNIVTIFERQRLFSCEEKRDEERRGLFGFHAYRQCPNCRIEVIGHEARAGTSILSPFLAEGRDLITRMKTKYPTAVVQLGGPVVYKA